MSEVDDHNAWRARVRRNDLANQGLCINGASHGKATHGVKCEWCDFVRKHGVARAVTDLAVTLRPPGYKTRVSVLSTSASVEAS